MKQSMFISAILLATTFTMSACGESSTETATEQQSLTTEEFTVKGNCGMCKNRIETALEKLEGVESGTWGVESKLLKVSYDSAKISLSDIHEAIAAVGHDTDQKKADDKVYSSLMGCCQYDK